MTAVLPVLVDMLFAAAAATALATIAASIAPHWRRIARLAAGRVEAA